MRTTIDMPDGLMQRVREVSAARKTTFRALVIEALEKSLLNQDTKFELRDASAGKPRKSEGISAEQINAELDAQREGSFSL
jgi:hypothetical protein